MNGDEIIVPLDTYIATILAITDNRLKPVLAEPDNPTCKSYDLSVLIILSTIGLRGIMVVHLYGRTWSKELEHCPEA